MLAYRVRRQFTLTDHERCRKVPASPILQRAGGCPRADLHLLPTVSIPVGRPDLPLVLRVDPGRPGGARFLALAFVFMPGHVYLIVYPRRPDYDISAILKAVKEPVGRQAIGYLAKHAPDWLPRIMRRRGERTERLFWQSGGGFDRNIWEPTGPC